MSLESIKRNSPLVDLKTSESDREPRKRNTSKPENSCVEDVQPPEVEDRGERKGSAARSNASHGKRYFIIKSLNHQNIQLSIEKGIWATQVMNEPILDAAYHTSDEVILIFSVNMSGFFQGYARMTSSVGWRRDNVWGQGCGGSNPWGRSFKVKWLRLSDLPFEKTLHLKNPLNDYKPVKISRDCQELTEDTGQALCQLLDEFENVNALESYGIPLKRHCVNPSSSVQGSEYNMAPVDAPWVGPQMIYPSSIYQIQAETTGGQSSHSKSHGMIFPESTTSSSSKSNQMRQSRSRRSLTSGQADQAKSSKLNNWDFSAEMDPLCTLSEDDFLKMSYEEYLEAYSRCSKRLQRSVSILSCRLFLSLYGICL
uniref:YTH domain-containing family protein n=1 Tax=Kalanchoe fedtschenkoi TaxID=63787 RepID=A0A7N1A471_KALFE